MRFEDFKALATEMTVEEFNEKYNVGCDYGDTLPAAIISYDGFFIEKMNHAQAQKAGGRYHLLLERSEYVDNDLDLLVGILWFDFAAYEMNNGDAGLHEIAEDFMKWALPDAEPLSLDEWLIANKTSLTTLTERLGNELLSLFSGYGGTA